MALSDMNMQNQFNKMSVLNVKQFRKYPKTKARKIKDIQVLLYKFKALNFCFQIQGLSSFVRTLCMPPPPRLPLINMICIKNNRAYFMLFRSQNFR
jgi:hypothetical protein